MNDKQWRMLKMPSHEALIQKFVAGVDLDACVGCGHCITTCARGVFAAATRNNMIIPDPVNLDNCVGCGTCMRVCPTPAILVRPLEAVEAPAADEEGYSVGVTQGGKTFRQSFVKRIDEDKCIDCGWCAWVCSRNCYNMMLAEDHIVAQLVAEEGCVGDGACARVCPTNAIY